MKKSIALKFNQLFSLVLALAFTTLTFGCGDKKNEGGDSSMISGTSSKIWKADKETNAAGDKDKLTSAEKEEQIQFFANGNFTQTSNSQSANGTWTYDASTKTLSLTYANNSVSENFTVTELTKNDMKLQAPDGSTLAMEAE